MFVSIYYKPSLFNAHTMIFIVHIFMNVNKLCLNQILHHQNSISVKFKKQNKKLFHWPTSSHVWRGFKKEEKKKKVEWLEKDENWKNSWQKVKHVKFYSDLAYTGLKIESL